jgi:serine/threonine protein kinase
MPLSTGVRLGVYEVTALIGEGGMGQVYRARDTKLNRDVALKILPDAFASDPDRLARFTREAQTLAALNHPNIAHIHGFEETAGVRALVMELVEGEDLAQRIARGAIPVAEALPIAKQIADALEAAHEQGIIHRDLKPGNIKVRDDGTVKVLDFGLAKALEPAVGAGANVTMSPTITTPAMTQMGLILGTAAYMSPEQARDGLPTSAATSGPSGACSSRCSPADVRSTAMMYRRRWHSSSRKSRTGRGCRMRRLGQSARFCGGAWRRIAGSGSQTLPTRDSR